MADNSALTGQYSVVATFLAGYAPSYYSHDTVESARIASYSFYKNLYWNDAGGFRMTLRGDEDFPVYIPSARRIINTFNRYVAKDPSLAITGTTAAQVDAAKIAFEQLFKRERFWSLFKHNKRHMLIKGDMVLGLFADPEKPEGARISIVDVDPGTFFPILDTTNKKKVWGQSIVELVHIGDKDYVRVQRWLKPISPDHPQYSEPPNYEAEIAYEDITWEMESWYDPEKRKAFATTASLDILPGIVTLPLYHFANNKDPNNTYGTSDLMGLERIFLAINQTATDEDVAIAMAGLGVYASDSTPVDDDGGATDWVLGPKRVVETPVGGKFERISGVSTVSPSQDHMDWIQGQAESILGISDVALGQAEVAVAESGIALALRMAPLLDAAIERDEEIHDVLIQMFHDLKDWFKVYERVDLGDDLTGAVIEPVFGDKLPKDRAAELTLLSDLFLNKVIPIQIYWSKLRDLGVDLPEDAELTKLFEDASQLMMDNADPAGARLAAEANAAVDTTNVNSDGGLV